MLRRLNETTGPQGMNVPGWNLHPLKGDLKGHFSVQVSGNWRMTFMFEDGDAVLVNYQDYHQENTMRMYNPPHPGLTLRNDVLPALGLSVTDAAKQLGVARVTLSRVLNGHSAISPEMALRIEAWLGLERGGEARLWLAEQTAYDMWQAEQKIKAAPLHVQRAPELRDLAPA